jgi:hypothetical protein
LPAPGAAPERGRPSPDAVAAQFEFLQNDDVAYFLGEPSFWMVMTVTAAAGFLINVAIFLQIKVTTPLTNTISGTAKVCVCVWFRPCAPSSRAHDRPRWGRGIAWGRRVCRRC